MNIIYAKSVLYAYKSLNALIEQIDELVEKKALSSIRDLSPAAVQCEKIISFTAQKDVLIYLKKTVDEILKSYSKEDADYFDYKYFHAKPKDYYINFDYVSRAYFRKQIKLADSFSKRLSESGINDEWFTENCLKTDFFKELIKRVIEREENGLKNKPKKNTDKLRKEDKPPLAAKKLKKTA